MELTGLGQAHAALLQAVVPALRGALGDQADTVPVLELSASGHRLGWRLPPEAVPAVLAALDGGALDRVGDLTGVLLLDGDDALAPAALEDLVDPFTRLRARLACVAVAAAALSLLDDCQTVWAACAALDEED